MHCVPRWLSFHNSRLWASFSFVVSDIVLANSAGAAPDAAPEALHLLAQRFCLPDLLAHSRQLSAEGRSCTDAATSHRIMLQQQMMKSAEACFQAGELLQQRAAAAGDRAPSSPATPPVPPPTAASMKQLLQSLESLQPGIQASLQHLETSADVCGRYEGLVGAMQLQLQHLLAFAVDQQQTAVGLAGKLNDLMLQVSRQVRAEKIGADPYHII